MDLPPAEALTVAAGNLITGRGLLRGFSLKEASASIICRLTINDGSAGGQLLAVINLLADESIRDWFPGAGIVFEAGVFVTISTGSVSGVFYVTPETRFRGLSFPSEWIEGNT